MSMIEYFEQMWALATDGQAQGVFFWGSLYVCMMLLYSLVYQIKVTYWPGTKGELIDERIREFGHAYAPSDKDYAASVSYKYVVDGKEYVGKRLSPWLFITNNNAKYILKKQLKLIFRLSDGVVMVYYNPRKPNKSYLIKPGLFGKFLTVFLAIIPILTYWLKYHD